MNSHNCSDSWERDLYDVYWIFNCKALKAGNVDFTLINSSTRGYAASSNKYCHVQSLEGQSMVAAPR